MTHPTSSWPSSFLVGAQHRCAPTRHHLNSSSFRAQSSCGSGLQAREIPLRLVLCLLAILMIPPALVAQSPVAQAFREGVSCRLCSPGNDESQATGHDSRVTFPDLTVHEWGTFTSIAGPHGDSMDWLPLTDSTDLPSFVEHFRDVHFKGGLRGTVRMETPVLYFYSSQEGTVSVDISFLKGLITEWYPHADSVNADLNHKDFAVYMMQNPGSISWNSVHISPQAAPDFPAGKPDNHYYAARQTSSAAVVVSTPAGTQREKFLFYRGVAGLPTPLTAEISSDGTITLHDDVFRAIKRSQLQVHEVGPANTAFRPEQNLTQLSDAAESSNEIPNVILFERRGAQMGYRVLGPLQDQASLAPPALDGSADSLYSTLEGMLVSQGLFADEAHAMLETWKNSWFEEGSRLIYIVPRSYIDSVLRLRVNPAPANTTRVFVGRLELVTPTTQHAVESAFLHGDLATLAKYSRFLEPILMSMIQQTQDESRQRQLLAYLSAAPTP
jgi:hypothetical protein